MKIFQLIFSLLVISRPGLALAATSSLQNILTNIPLFIDMVVIPFLFGIAFLIFVINIIRYLVIDADNKEARENAKNIALYSVFAFVFLIIFWGIVNLLSDSSGFIGDTAPCPDYLKGKSGGC